MVTEPIYCLQCGESQAAIRESQRGARLNIIFCGAVDYFGELEWSAERHRFRDWSYDELEGMGILPDYHHLYRRVSSTWGIDPAHLAPKGQRLLDAFVLNEE